MRLKRFRQCLLIIPLITISTAASAAEWAFEVKFAQSVRKEPFSGRVCLFLNAADEPRTASNWFRPGRIVARDVTNWKLGDVITFRSNEPNGLLSYPKPPGEIDPTGLRVQAVARFNSWEREVGSGPRNGFSQVVLIAKDSMPPVLVIDHLVPEKEFPESKEIKFLRVRSQRLSDFYKHDVYLQAAVTLPPSYADHPERKYPTVYEIPGFGGTHFLALRIPSTLVAGANGVEFLHIMLDPSCPLGHHVFADSANNGPCGTALVEEFIPAFEKTFRAVAEPAARFLTGHSSGGWSSFWLQITHPETFAGTWSTSPDPVDFRSFQYIDLYRTGENMYVDAQGQQRPLARLNGKVIIWYRPFDEMELALGDGGQLHSFEAVFSPRGNDGRPLQAWNTKTGAVDMSVTKEWEKYDIRLVLERNWPALAPKLGGKLHLFMGDEDTFYLEGAAKLLKESLAKLGSDAVVEIDPGKSHFTLLTPELRTRIRTEMADAFLKSHPGYAAK
jgi:S-formylglutathione hydrolase FrmB